jgi:DinB superfamily
MNGIAAIQASLEATRSSLHWFVSDFSDADLLVRPVPGANHTAWQIGNVIVGDVFMIKAEVPSAVYPELPPGFADLHGPEGAKKDGPEGFLTKAQYLDLLDKTRAATIAALVKLSEADLDRQTGENFRSWAPTVGHLFLMTAHHTLMHAGQFTVIRRKLGKPILF